MRISLLQAAMVAIAACLPPAVSAQQSSPLASQELPADITKFSLNSMGKIDIYFPMNGNYNIAAAESRFGPNRSFFKQTHLPVGQTLGNWTEQMSFVVLDIRAPGLAIVTNGSDKECEKGYSIDKIPAPEFLVGQSKTDAVLETCKKSIGKTPFTVHALHIAVVTPEYEFVLSRIRRDPFPGEGESEYSELIKGWQRTFAKFATCPRDVQCFKLK